MTTARQQTPIAFAQQRLTPKMTVAHGMEIPLEFSSAEIEHKRKASLGICDVSCFPRFGVKGRNVVQWLKENKVEIPDPNSWVQQGDSLVLRLGNGEFLVEDQLEGKLCAALDGAVMPEAYGVYKIRRNDAALMLSGSHVRELFSEICAIDLRDGALLPGKLVMTQMAGISATVLRQKFNGEDVFRLWCDGTYSPYLWDTLLKIAEEFGGGAVGLSCHFKEMP
ncbi:MAG: sarcosine oxidase subunit gamma [Methylobacillus sp.]|jgi:sarcosine oxidase subunit gamma|nr:sarcosine oxidase subunit gamma [Methylobacillus sp.]